MTRIEHVRTVGPRGRWADRVAPVEVVGEAAARVAHERDAEVAGAPDHLRPQRTAIIQHAVAVAHPLDVRAEQLARDLPHDCRRIDRDGRRRRRCPACGGSLRRRRPRGRLAQIDAAKRRRAARRVRREREDNPIGAVHLQRALAVVEPAVGVGLVEGDRADRLAAGGREHEHVRRAAAARAQPGAHRQLAIAEPVGRDHLTDRERPRAIGVPPVGAQRHHRRAVLRGDRHRAAAAQRRIQDPAVRHAVGRRRLRVLQEVPAGVGLRRRERRGVRTPGEMGEDPEGEQQRRRRERGPPRRSRRAARHDAATARAWRDPGKMP